MACIDAILSMVVRGAPCIGFTGIFGVAYCVSESKKVNEIDKDIFLTKIHALKNARPTAVNLSYEIDRAITRVDFNDADKSFVAVIEFALNEINESENRHVEMSKHAYKYLQNIYGDKKLTFHTHCNTGRLACASHGTALGLIEYCHKLDKVEKVWVDETRPYLQGARLTAFELSYMNAPHQVIADSAAAFVMKNNQVDAVVVGADRIAMNGDTANKIGTYNLAITAKHFNVPFLVLAPISSFDANIADGSSIEIELRNKNEISHFKEHQITPTRSDIYNPSFDITTSDLISAIVTEKGVITHSQFSQIKEMIL